MIICISIGETIQIAIQVVTLVITVFGIIIAIIQLNNFNQQLKLNFFADYTKRYQEIILNFPESINQETFDYNNLTEEDRNKTYRYMRAYFDLCSEEFHLKKQSNIDKVVWATWEEGIKFALSKKAFIDAWSHIKKDTKYNKDFSSWVESIMPKA